MKVSVSSRSIRMKHCGARSDGDDCGGGMTYDNVVGLCLAFMGDVDALCKPVSVIMMEHGRSMACLLVYRFSARAKLCSSCVFIHVCLGISDVCLHHTLN